MSSAVRYLGFAFANADLLFEVDPSMRVSFVAGAMREFAIQEDLPGRAAPELFAPADAIRFMGLLQGLPEGGRVGPISLELADGRISLLSLCRLPQDSARIFCTLSHPGARKIAGGTVNALTGLIERDGFLQLASMAGVDTMVLTLVDVPRLVETLGQLSPARHDALFKRIGTVVRAAGICGAGQLGPSTFGVISPVNTPVRLGADLLGVLGDEGFAHAQVAQCAVDLSDGELSAEQRCLALGYVARCIADEKQPSRPGMDIGRAYAEMIADVDERLRHLTETVLKSELHVEVRPVIRIDTGETVYHETRAHLDPEADARAILRIAQAIRPADVFDIMLLSRGMAALAACDDAKLAVSISGNTFSTSAGRAILAGLLARQDRLRGRLKIALYGSAHIDDLESMAHAVKALRDLGIEVGLAEVGADAMFLRCLHAVHFDFVRFDRSLIRTLGESRRRDGVVRGLVTLCRDLGISTVAEGVEDDTVLTRVKTCGFECAEISRPQATSMDQKTSPRPDRTDAFERAGTTG